MPSDDPPDGKEQRKPPRVSDLTALLRSAERLDERPCHPGDSTPFLRFARTFLYIRDREGIARPLHANPAQFAFEQHRDKRNIILKARQMGITTWVAARFFLKTIARPNVLTVQVAHTQDAAESIFRVVQRFWEYLPEDARAGDLRRSIANVRSMRFPEIDSEFRVLSAADPNAGRGMTIAHLHCSEVARWPRNAAETLAGLRAALAPGGELVIESTPNGAYGCFYEEWNKAVEPASGSPYELDQEADHGGALIRHFFPWWMEPAYRSAAATDLSPEEQALVLRHGLTPRQIGFRRSLEAGYRQLRSQEFAEDTETCFRATGECCFDVDAIETRLASIGPPAESRRGGALQIWLPWQPGRQYIVAVDTTGGGSAGDFAAVQVVELATGLQCAELQQRIRPMELTRVAVALAREYGDAVIAVERNNHGAGVLAYLDSLEHYTKLYRQAGEPGWLTSLASKPAMVALIGTLLAQSPWVFLSRRLLAECRTFVALAGGRSGAAPGAHDDCLMAMAVAQSVRAELLTSRKML